MSALDQFRDVYGMRPVGLEDNMSSVYGAYRVPDPEAPYPQDYVIDQNGIVRYWSWESDPQEVMRVIDRLLGQAGVPEHSTDPLQALQPGPQGVGLRRLDPGS